MNELIDSRRSLFSSTAREEHGELNGDAEPIPRYTNIGKLNLAKSFQRTIAHTRKLESDRKLELSQLVTRREAPLSFLSGRKAPLVFSMATWQSLKE